MARHAFRSIGGEVAVKAGDEPRPDTSCFADEVVVDFPSVAPAVDRIRSYGIRVMAGFIIGFDGEKTGAGDRIVEFVSRTGIPAAMVGMLQALPNTGLWHRLEKEGPPRSRSRPRCSRPSTALSRRSFR